jgi:hypothetical protein
VKRQETKARIRRPGARFIRLIDATIVVNPLFIEASFKFSPNQAVGIECDFSQPMRC